jgi:hypothetical protein
MPKQKAAAKKPAPSASAADQAVDAANKRCDALDKRSDLAAFQSYTCSDFTVRLETCTVASIPKELQDWAYDLCKTNMEAMYKKVWGWNNNKKRRQFAAPASRFCVAFLDREGQQPEPVGYVNYRWDGGAAAGGRGRARPPASRLHAKPAAQSARPPSPPRPAPTCRPPWPPLAPHLPTRQAATPPSGAGPCPPPHTPATPALTRAPPPCQTFLAHPPGTRARAAARCSTATSCSWWRRCATAASARGSWRCWRRWRRRRAWGASCSR